MTKKSDQETLKHESPLPVDPEKTSQETFLNFNCAQSVFLPFALAQGWSREDALKVASGLGGGMGRLQEACGALSGGVLAIGLWGGQIREGDTEAKNRTYARVRELSAKFTGAHGSTCCRKLLGVDLQTEEGQRAFAEGNMHGNLCSRFVTDAARWTRDILQS